MNTAQQEKAIEIIRKLAKANFVTDIGADLVGCVLCDNTDHDQDWEDDSDEWVHAPGCPGVMAREFLEELEKGVGHGVITVIEINYFNFDDTPKIDRMVFEDGLNISKKIAKNITDYSMWSLEAQTEIQDKAGDASGIAYDLEEYDISIDGLSEAEFQSLMSSKGLTDYTVIAQVAIEETDDDED